MQNRNHGTSGRPVDWEIFVRVGILVKTELGVYGTCSAEEIVAPSRYSSGTEETWTDLRELRRQHRNHKTTITNLRC